MERFDLYPERLIGDSAYGSAEMLDWLVHDHGIEPHIPVFDKSKRTDGTFSREDFTYDHAERHLLLPGRQSPPASAVGSRRRGSVCQTTTCSVYRASKTIAGLPAEIALLPQRAGAQGSALDPRRRTRSGPRHRQDRGVPDLAPPAEEG